MQICNLTRRAATKRCLPKLRYAPNTNIVFTSLWVVKAWNVLRFIAEWSGSIVMRVFHFSKCTNGLKKVEKAWDSIDILCSGCGWNIRTSEQKSEQKKNYGLYLTLSLRAQWAEGWIHNCDCDLLWKALKLKAKQHPLFSSYPECCINISNWSNKDFSNIPPTKKFWSPPN